MEGTAKSIGNLINAYLPGHPHHLSISATAQYALPANNPRPDEDIITQLQYMTYLHDVDRGVLFTRAEYDIIKEPEIEYKNALAAQTPRTDPNKPVTKLSLKDYKNRKVQSASAEGDAPKKSATSLSHSATATKQSATEPAPGHKKHLEPPSIAREMGRDPEPRKAHPSLPPKPDIKRPRSPSPEKKKRASDVLDSDRAAKRAKLESPMPNGKASSLHSKSTTPQINDRPASHAKKPSKDLKSSGLVNGRSALSNSAKDSASPRPSSQVNGSQKSINSSHGTPKKEKPFVPSLLSPLGFSADDYEITRPAAKKPADSKGAKKPREDPDPSPRKTKSKIPPLLSPLPEYIRDEIEKGLKDGILKPKVEASQKSTPTSSQKSNASDSQSTARKGPAKSIKKDREDTIHVESKTEKKDVKREEDTKLIVKMKYRKRLAQTISRLLALPPKKTDTAKREASESIKKEEHAGRDRSVSVEPAPTARKRPRIGPDINEPPAATKRPRTSDIAQPATPSKQSVTMQRVASSSSQAGTPGAVNTTPAPPTSSDRRYTPADLEKVGRLKKRCADYQGLGTRLKHAREKSLKPPPGGNAPPQLSHEERLHGMAMAIQIVLSYMVGFQALDESRDAERKARDPSHWKSIFPLLRLYRHECQSSGEVHALLLRLFSICQVWTGRAINSLPLDSNIARDMSQNVKDQETTWKMAEQARKKLDDPDGYGGGEVARLIDRLGPWSSPDEAAPVVLKVLRRAIRVKDGFTPVRELVDVANSMTNGARG
ncbi:hypothetical protein PG993_007983 [Apiospora rasikravindrae]|uniref:Uncharacterized protein n=1 Tax=Apiospora rasikravindrae TaxID=990691 RepID=A0ABR1SZ11_9PEZI